MKKSNAAISAFIDEKYIPLEPKYKIIIALLLVILPIAMFYFLYFQPKTDEITKLEQRKAKLTQELKSVKKRARDLAKFEEEVKQTQAMFDEVAELLPKEKEIPQLLKDISSLGRVAGLDFLKFQPLVDRPKDFYAEIPVNINVRGPYHNMGFFFDQVSKLDRIVSVTNVKMSGPKRVAGEMLLNSNCKLMTYRFTNVALPKDNKKNKKRKR